MLTGDLINFRRDHGIVPVFAAEDDASALACADSLTVLYREAAAGGMTRGELEELSGALVKGASDARLGAGIDKLLLDHTDFAIAGETDWAGERETFFRSAAQLMAQPGEMSLTAYRRGIGELESRFPGSDPYCDLPELEKVIRVPDWGAVEVLRRYNVALVQALLLHAERVVFTFPHGEAAQMRRIFKYLKFFRLLGEVRRSREEPDTLILQVSGPCELFENTRKYALQLANFFPAVLTAAAWRLDAKLRLGGRAAAERLLLDESSGLRSSYHTFSAYVPEEIRLYHDHFRKTEKEWEIVGEAPFFPAGDGQGLIFPDLSFRRRSDGVTLHLELFHRWHRGQLGQRLVMLAAHPEVPLLLGIDTAIADRGVTEFLASHPGIAGRTFTFRDFPGVEKTRKALEETLIMMKDER